MEIELFEGGFGLEAVDTRARSRCKSTAKRGQARRWEIFLWRLMERSTWARKRSLHLLQQLQQESYGPP